MPAFEGFGVGFLQSVQVDPSRIEIGVTDGVEVDLGGEEGGKVKLRLSLPDEFRDQGSAASGETGFRNLEGLVEKVAVERSDAIAEEIDLLVGFMGSQIPAADPEGGILGIVKCLIGGPFSTSPSQLLGVDRAVGLHGIGEFACDGCKFRHIEEMFHHLHRAWIGGSTGAGKDGPVGVTDGGGGETGQLVRQKAIGGGDGDFDLFLDFKKGGPHHLLLRGGVGACRRDDVKLDRVDTSGIER